VSIGGPRRSIGLAMKSGQQDSDPQRPRDQV
jgi:hypothetical protein